MNYQHYQAYGATHYPQYTPQHYTQYAAQTATIPTAPTATTSTSTTSAAPLSRQATQTPAVETDQNADISTLNDAVGSAGLDLRVSIARLILMFSGLLIRVIIGRRRDSAALTGLLWYLQEL